MFEAHRGNGPPSALVKERAPAPRNRGPPRSPVRRRAKTRVPWYMFGGTFIFSSDARFRRAAGHYGAVPLHDRRE